VLAVPKVRAGISGHTHVGRSGTVPRSADSDPLPLPVAVIPSDYHAPAFLALEAP
jgi:hypothetical protein